MYINNFKYNKKNGVKYLLPLGVGIIISIIVFSKLITILLDNYYLPTMLFFIGLVLGGLPQIIEKVENKNIAILGFSKEGKSTYNFIKRHNGNKHILKDCIKDRNGNYHDDIIYEIVNK